MSKSCCVTRYTANKLNNPEIIFYKLSTPKNGLFQDIKGDRAQLVPELLWELRPLERDMILKKEKKHS